MSLSAPFQNKVIAVSGASRGIGLALTKYLLARGATVSMCATSSENLAKALESIHQEFPDAQDRVMTCVVDVSKLDMVKSWIEQTVAKFGPLDGCCNNAGMAQQKLFPMTELDPDYFNKVMSVNVSGTFYCLKEEMKVIKDGGSIVNIGSAASKYAIWGTAGTSAYVASKHAVIGLTKSAAFEGAARGIRVNAICPGTIDTDMMATTFDTPQGESQLVGGPAPSLIKRLGTPEEVAASIAFLLGDESKFINRATYYVDGGWLESA